MKRETEKKIAAGLIMGLFIWLVIGIPPTTWALRLWARLWIQDETDLLVAQSFGCVALVVIWVLMICVFAKEPEKEP